MNTEKDILWDAIARGISEGRETDDNQLLEQWLQNESNSKSFEILSNLEIQSKIGIDPDDKNKVFRDVLQRIQANGSSKTQRKINFYITSAASILILITLGVWFSLYQKQNTKSQVVNIYSPKGVKSKLKLSDGTSIVLNSESKLSYDAQFKGSDRIVNLEGEAYFEVSKDVKRPFIVKTSDIQVEVTGTKLNVKAYSTDKSTETTLLEGSLNLNIIGDDNKSIQLKPGEQAIYLKNKNNIILRKAPVGSDGWKDGKYIFKSMPFDEIAKILERGFNIKIDIQSTELKNETFSGDFIHGESLVQILSIISLNEKISFQVYQDRVVIKNK